MKGSLLALIPAIFGVVAAEYVGPQNGIPRFRNGNGNGNGHGNGNGNGNGNAYGVPTDSITPPQEQGPSGPYPPSGWKPAGRRLLLPGESRGVQQPIDSGYGQPPPPQYGPAVNPAPSRPPTNQYGPSVDNQYIPGTGFGGNGNGGNGHNGNGNGNGNGFGNGGNGHTNGGNGQNGHNGNGFGNGHNGNGHNGNGHNGNGHNGNGHNGNGHNGNGQNGNGHNGNGGNGGNGHNGSNGNGNGGNGAGNGVTNGNGFSNGGNGANGNGKGSGNGLTPSFHNSFFGQGAIPSFVQLSVPTTLAAVGPSNGGAPGNVYPVFHVPYPNSYGAFAGSSYPVNGHPLYQGSTGVSDLNGVSAAIRVPVTATQGVGSIYSAALTQGGFGNGVGQYYTLLTNSHPQKSNLIGLRNRLNDFQLQYAISHPTYDNGVPLSIF